MAKNIEIHGWRVFQSATNSASQDSWRSFKQNAELNLIKTKKQAGGWRAKKAGDSAENQVMLSGSFYLNEGRAEVKKRPEPYRRIGAAKTNGQFTAVPIAKSGPDFDICLPNGKAGLIEVKSRKGNRMPISAVGDAQRIALQRRVDWEGFGVILLMLWDFAKVSQWWVIDIRRWDEAIRRGYKSLRAEELDLIAVRCPFILSSKGSPDYLDALLQAHQEASEHPWPIDRQISSPQEVGIDPNEQVDESIYWESEEVQIVVKEEAELQDQILVELDEAEDEEDED